ncbi:MAG TPA: DNA replication/repair protein RecF [Sphingomicrobium sp.]|nr:DNA replication/repair protein RecF [Sphingomicrobium sp.]
MLVNRVTLTDFRSYDSASLEPGGGFVLLFGENGAGKTNLLEAVSMLAPGRGLRGAALSDMARLGGSGGWAVSARLGAAEIGTGTLGATPERRQVRINGAAASVNSLSEWLSVLWLTPAMDRLFTGSAGDRRRFLDRLVLALEPTHAHHSARYEAAMRARNKLLQEERWDETWLTSLEAQMQEHGNEVTLARERTIKALGNATSALRGDDFPSASLRLDKQAPMDLAARLSASRKIDCAARRASHGPNNEDLLVIYSAKDQPAARSSTGEQKALLINILLSHAEVVAEKRGDPPILLLDEIAAHLDPKRRAALFARLEGRGQVWMTATEATLFAGIGAASRFHVEPGKANPT